MTDTILKYSIQSYLGVLDEVPFDDLAVDKIANHLPHLGEAGVRSILEAGRWVYTSYAKYRLRSKTLLVPS